MKVKSATTLARSKASESGNRVRALSSVRFVARAVPRTAAAQMTPTVPRANPHPAKCAAADPTTLSL